MVGVVLYFLSMFFNVFIKVKKTCFLCFFYLQINVLTSMEQDEW